MYYIIANTILKKLLNSGYIKPENVKLKQKVIEYTISFVINILIASGIGHTLQIENEMIMFSIFYTALKISNGGNYLKLNIKENVTLWGFGAIALIGSEYIIGDVYGKFVLLLFLAISFLLVIVGFPFKMQKINLPEKVQQELKRKSIITVSMECICLAVGVFAFQNSIIAAAVFGVFVQSISLLPASNNHKQLVDLRVYALY